MTELITKEGLIYSLRLIREHRWFENARPGNSGGVGNTLEDLLGLKENNLPIPNAAEWELKCQRLGSSSLTTLFHMEPSPRAVKHVSEVLLPYYGWLHQSAGQNYPKDEMSFRQTVNAINRTDRGFGIVLDREHKKVTISFCAKSVAKHHRAWLKSVKRKVGLSELNPQPYWGFDDLFYKAGTKLHNCFYIQAEAKKEKGKEFFHYTTITMLEKFSFEKFISSIEQGYILADFDARSGHNHGTKFRLRQDKLPELYEQITIIE